MEYQLLEILGKMRYHMSGRVDYVIAHMGLGFSDGDLIVIPDGCLDFNCTVVEDDDHYWITTENGTHINDFKKENVTWEEGKGYIIIEKVSEINWRIKGVKRGIEELLL